MGESSRIAWTDATFNPWIGCSRVSPACENCYAEALAHARFEGPPGKKVPLWGVDAARKPMSEAYWRGPLKWNEEAKREGKRRRVFCASLADVFERIVDRNVGAAHVVAQARARLGPLIEQTPWLDWLLLTKRPGNVREMVSFWGWGIDRPWPANVWLGVTAEDQRRAEERIPILLSLPATIHFVSHEPALERVDFTKWLRPSRLGFTPRPFSIDWLITGGESGPGARIYDLEWARDIIRQTKEAHGWNGWNNNGPFAFVKQMGANAHDSRLTIIGGWQPGDPEPETRVRFRDRAGADPSEWEPALRVQEFPA